MPPIRCRLNHDQAAARNFRTGVSLHSHTECSRESLEFIPRYTQPVPILRSLIAAQQRRFRRLHGYALNFRKAWWTPPLSPRAAYDTEKEQIEQRLQLAPLVSLSDHDEIEACVRLRLVEPVPVSLEWTVPYGPSFFHIGVHNLPPLWARQVVQRLQCYTRQPREQDLPELFSILHGLPSVLIVFNHPFWDEFGIGADAHQTSMLRFLRNHREWIHALELNGLRPWQENLNTVSLSSACGIPLISGGDRHGREPNANLNLTNASTFDEFCCEVRRDRRSEILFMPQYSEPLRLRVVQGILDVLRHYPEHSPARRHWTGRIFFETDNGTVKPLSDYWLDDGPLPIGIMLRTLRLLESEPLRGLLRSTPHFVRTKIG